MPNLPTTWCPTYPQPGAQLTPNLVPNLPPTWCPTYPNLVPNLPPTWCITYPQPGAQLTPCVGQVGHFNQHFLNAYRDQSIYCFLSNLYDYVAQDPTFCFCSILHLEY